MGKALTSGAAPGKRTEKSMKVSLHLPIENVIEATDHGEALRIIAHTAEDAGFDACNLTDHPAPTAAWRNQTNMTKTGSGGHDAFDPFTGLAFIAAATSRIRLHTHILVLPYRNPFITAKAGATLDLLSGGRLTLGVASGYLQGEYDAVGVAFEDRGTIMTENLQAWKLAWSGEAVSLTGRTFKADNILPMPLPVQRPHPPIWGGGNGEAAIRRAAQHCDGWSPFFAAPEHAAKTRTEALVTLDDMREKIAVLRAHLERAERAGQPFDICCAPPTKRVEDYTAAEARKIVDIVGQMAGLGISWIVASMPQGSLAQFLEGLHWYAEEVLRHIHPITERTLV